MSQSLHQPTPAQEAVLEYLAEYHMETSVFSDADIVLDDHTTYRSVVARLVGLRKGGWVTSWYGQGALDLAWQLTPAGKDALGFFHHS